MATLLACPFCRELFTKGEHERCPACDVVLQALDQLPPSLEALQEAALEGEIIAPEDRLLPLGYWRRGRGALLLLGILGLVCFFLPWVEMTRPELVTMSGYALAHGRAGWLWGGAIGWFILIPLVWTRRTIYKMRGVRIICTTFASMTLLEVLMLVALPPAAGRHASVDFGWGPGLYASALVSALGIFFGTQFGGRADPPEPPAAPLPQKRPARVKRRGETLH
jgi:hypothetical protein